MFKYLLVKTFVFSVLLHVFLLSAVQPLFNPFNAPSAQQLSVRLLKQAGAGEQPVDARPVSARPVSAPIFNQSNSQAVQKLPEHKLKRASLVREDKTQAKVLPRTIPKIKPAAKIAPPSAPSASMLTQIADADLVLSSSPPSAAENVAATSSATSSFSDANDQQNAALGAGKDGPKEGSKGGAENITNAANAALAGEAGASFSISAMNDYRIAIGLAAKRFKRYPSLARSRGWEGKVELRLMVHGARAPSINITRSSGREVLDEQALEMLQQAFYASHLPKDLQGQAFQMPFLFEFNLDEE